MSPLIGMGDREQSDTVTEKAKRGGKKDERGEEESGHDTRICQHTETVGTNIKEISEHQALSHTAPVRGAK